MPRFFADLHIHSRYSRATSRDISLETLERGAKQKGLNVIGTGDFTHPTWFDELKRNLTESDGLYHYKDKNFSFMLQAEVCNMYQQDGKGRRIHNILLAPSIEVVSQINDSLKRYGSLTSDGRPIFSNLTCIEMTEMLVGISKDIAIIPAHAWTPWFGILGSKSGFDSIEECFGDQSKNIFAIETGLSCYDKETEVLTNNGWKNFDRVDYDDKICTLNIENNNIEFQKPTKIHSYPYKGKMYRIKTKRLDLLVTPNHRLLYSKCDFRKPPKFLLEEAESLFGRSKRFKKDGIWVGKDAEWFTLPAVKIKHGSRYYSGLRCKKEKSLSMKSWLKFFGFWIAEGWTTEGKDGDYNVCVSNRNHDLIHEMEEILHSFGFNTFWNDKTSTLRVRDFQLFQYLKQFGKCYDKFVPEEVKTLSKELLEIFLRYYIKGDGHIYGRSLKGMSATTSSIRLRDDMQEIALKVGMSAYYKLDKKRGTPFNISSNKKIYKQREDTWVVYFIRKNIHTVLPSTVKKYNYTEAWVDFKGSVFCVTVPNHVVYVRRNGIPVWCGNSDPPMNWRLSKLDRYALVSNSDSHSANTIRLGREFNAFELENPSYFEIIDAIRSKDQKRFLFTCEVPPAFGKYHLDGHRLCKVFFEPKESIKLHDICPVCGRELTIGVLHRVEELADRPEGFVPNGAIPFKSLIPLAELMAVAYNTQTYSKKVWEDSTKLISEFGSELSVLLEAPEDRLRLMVSEKVVDAIIRNRKGEVRVQPGYDGEYGFPILDDAPIKKSSNVQKSLTEF